VLKRKKPAVIREIKSDPKKVRTARFSSDVSDKKGSLRLSRKEDLRIKTVVSSTTSNHRIIFSPSPAVNTLKTSGGDIEDTLNTLFDARTPASLMEKPGSESEFFFFPSWLDDAEK
jgi:hypothetical protein